MENQRIRITKQMLKTALISILQHTELGKVKINALCEKAQVNRTTFYKYYGSQYDLLDDIEHDILQDIADYIGRKDGASSLIKLLHYLESNRESCLVLIRIQKNEFAMKIFNMAELEFMNQLFRDTGKDERQWKYIKILSIMAAIPSLSTGCLRLSVSLVRRCRIWLWRWCHGVYVCQKKN